MEELIEKIEVEELTLNNAIEWLSKDKRNGVEFASLDAIIRFLIKENLKLNNELKNIKNENPNIETEEINLGTFKWDFDTSNIDLLLEKIKQLNEVVDSLYYKFQNSTNNN